MTHAQEQPPAAEAPKPVETAEEKARQIERRLQELQLRFADFKASQPEHAGRPFEAVLDDCTWLVRDLKLSATVFGTSPSPQEGESKVRETVERIAELRSRHEPGWEAEAAETLQAAKRWFKSDSAPKPRESFGLLNFNTTSEKRLERYGIEPEDKLLELHVMDAAQQPEAKLSARETLASFGRVAEMIIDKYPHVRAVVGRSWLVDRPLAKRLGFTVTEDVALPQRGMDVWKQFLDKDGDLDERKVRELFETGEPPHKSKLGFIPVEEFLRRYLPIERRGREIALKELSPERLRLKRAVEAAASAIGKKWETLDEAAIPAAVDESPELRAALESKGYKEKFIAKLREAKAAGLKWESVTGLRELRQMRDAVVYSLEKDLYVEKRLTIE